MIDGTAPPHGRGPERPGRRGGAGQVARVVVAVLRPAQAADRDEQHKRRGPHRERDGLGVERGQVQPLEGKRGQHREEHDERVGQIAHDLADGRVAEQRHDHLDEPRHDDHHDLGGPAEADPVHGEQQDHGGDDEVDALDLESDLGHPVEQSHQAVPILAERRPAHHERGGTRLRPLQAGQAEQRVEQVTHQDRQDGLEYGQAEGHDQGAVEQELHVEHRARP